MSDVVETVRAVLRDRPEPLAAAWVFGSHARGSASRASDLDLALLYLKTPPRTLLDLPLDLQDAVSRALQMPVDVIIVDEGEADFVHRVLRDGILVLERDRARRIDFEVRKRSEYFDLLPYLARYRRKGAA